MLAYDGRKSAYTAGQLPFASKDFVVKLVDEDRADRLSNSLRKLGCLFKWPLFVLFIVYTHLRS